MPEIELGDINVSSKNTFNERSSSSTSSDSSSVSSCTSDSSNESSSSDTVDSQSSTSDSFIPSIELPEDFCLAPSISVHHEQKTYSNSQLTVAETLAVLFSWFASFPGISKEAFSRLLFLLHTFILPENNNLPCSYHEAHRIIKRNLTSAQEYDCCPNDCILYTNEKKDLTSCPECGSDRFITNTMKACKTFKYLPLLPRIRRMFMCPSVSELIQKHSNVQSVHDTVCDIHDSQRWKYFYSEDGPYKGDS